MKKSPLICLTVFSGFILVGFIFTIILITLNYNANPNSFWTMLILSMMFSEISIVGTFVCSIIALVKSKNLQKSKNIVITTSIIGIVGGSISLIFLFLIYVASFLGVVGNILIIVVFILSIVSIMQVKKHNEFIIDTKPQNDTVVKQ